MMHSELQKKKDDDRSVIAVFFELFSVSWLMLKNYMSGEEGIRNENYVM